MSLFSWLHLSDLHLRGNEDTVDRGKFNSMLVDIKSVLEQEDLYLDAVFFTGDVAFAGKISQYNLVVEWIDRILETCGLSGQRDRFFVVPGNHDVDRDKVYKPSFRLSQYQDFARALLDPDRSYKEINEFLGDKEHRAWAFAKFRDFSQFSNDFYNNNIKFDHEKYYFVRSIEKSDFIVAVIGLNSAWLSFKDDEQGQLLLGERQICDAIEEVQTKYKNACLWIAMVHHPLYWLAEKDIHRVIQYLPNNFHLLLRGHLHCSSFSVQSTPDSHLHVFAAGASLKADYHAYNIVQLNLATGEGTAIVRVQHPDLGGNWGPDSFTYRNATEGKIGFSLHLRSDGLSKEE